MNWTTRDGQELDLIKNDQKESYHVFFVHIMVRYLNLYSFILCPYFGQVLELILFDSNQGYRHEGKGDSREDHGGRCQC